MKALAICFVAFLVTTNDTNGMTLLKKIHHQREETTFFSQDQITEVLKIQIKARLDQIDNVCPEGMKANCSVIQENIDTMLDQLYAGDETLAQNEEELESALIGAISAMSSEGLSDEEMACTFDTCMYASIILRHENGSKIPMCDVNSCKLKRAFRIRGLEQELKHTGEYESEDNSSEKEENSEEKGSDSHQDLHPENAEERNSTTGQENVVENENDAEEDLYDLCFLEGALDYCADTNNNDGCAKSIAENMYGALKRCISQSKESHTELLVKEIKRKLVQRRRQEAIKRLLNALRLEN